MGTPYIGFSNETLSKLPKVNVGDGIACDKCQGIHELRGGDDGSTILLFYTCGEKSYLGAVNGRSIIGTKSDVSGSI